MKQLNKTGKILIIGGAIALLIILGVFLSSCDEKGGKGGGSKPPPNEPKVCMHPDVEKKVTSMPGSTWHVVKETPKGSLVYSAVPFPDSVMRTVDRAVEFSITVQKRQHPAWTTNLTPQEYEVWFIPSDGLSPQQKVPFISLGGVMTAGTITFCNWDTPQRNAIVLPDHSSINWTNEDYLFWSVFNEGEHKRERAGDINVFNQFTGASDSHPHRPIDSDLLPPTLLARQTQLLPCAFAE